MAKDQNRRISPKVHAEDLELYSAMKSIDEYAPANQAYKLEAIDALHAAVLSTRDGLAAAEGTLGAARNAYAEAQWGLHNGILGVKDQVTAQFGPNSYEVQIMKLKKKVDYKRPTRKPKR